jgi:ribosome-binding protein aMBF1 (putative translation factor)
MQKVQGLSKDFGRAIAKLRVRNSLSQEKLVEDIDSTAAF